MRTMTFFAALTAYWYIFRALQHMRKRPIYNMAHVEGFDYEDYMLKPLSVLMGTASDMNIPPQCTSTQASLSQKSSHLDL